MTPAAVGLRCPEHSGKPQGVQKVTAAATRATTGSALRPPHAVTLAVIGRWRYLLLYPVSGIAGSAGALYHTPNSATAGASGAIFGVLGGLLVLERRGNIATGGQVLGLIVLNLIFTFAVPGVSIGGHV